MSNNCSSFSLDLYILSNNLSDSCFMILTEEAIEYDLYVGCIAIVAFTWCSLAACSDIIMSRV